MKTRNGTSFRLYAIDGAGHHPLHGAILSPDGWVSYEWTLEGFVSDEGIPGEFDICGAVDTVALRKMGIWESLEAVN